MVSPSIGIEVQVEHSDVDGLLDDPDYLVIFPVEDLYTLYGDLVVWSPIKVSGVVGLCLQCLRHCPSLPHVEAVAFLILLPTLTVNSIQPPIGFL